MKLFKNISKDGKYTYYTLSKWNSNSKQYDKFFLFENELNDIINQYLDLQKLDINE